MTPACQAPNRVSNEPLEPDRGAVDEATTDVLRSVWDEAAGELARLAGALGVGPGRTDDVLQDVFVAALEKASAIADRTDLRRWLFRVTVNRCNLEHRRGGRWQRAWQAIRQLRRGPTESPATTVSREEEKRLVRTALGRLHPRDQAILALRYFAEFDSKEIGRILNIPDATVRSRLRIARQQLADALKRLGYCHE